MKQDPYPRLEPGKYYHVYNRGNNKETIFKTSQNYHYFLARWIKYIEPVAKTFCYNLLSNHFHFFIRVEEADNSPQKTSQAFSNLFNAYAKAINKQYDRTGSLFQERFRRKEITSDAYFTSIVGYILTNAAKHGYCTDAAAYPYSAYRSLISDKPTKLLRDDLIRWFGTKERFISYIGSYRHDTNNLKMILENEMDD